MKRANSISVEELTAVAEKAAHEVLGSRMKELGAGVDIGIFPDIGTVGLIWRDPVFDRFDAVQMLDASKKIASMMGPVAEGARPSVRVFDGGVTAGFFPVEPIIMRELF
ncbi:hypothetical protein BXY66_2219 [Shimia isoporae]|uniref:Uncharacterized protein n=1 Tax=Shimia isoporae TaxID=647720 RepID=A0A4V2Q481_9RHOB|nr:hypothetical protein [Shimia isoporae]TCL10150.1 hypothetical protein BXY66_2219 [Shimia isoporae]